MTILILLVLAVLLGFAYAEWRPHRQHASVQSVLHAEIASLKRDIEKLDAKFDGGSIPK